MKRDKIMAGKGSGHVNSYIANTSPLLARTCLHVIPFFEPVALPENRQKNVKVIKMVVN